MRLLGLDLSSSVGWAVLERRNPPIPPRFGTLVLSGDNDRKLGQFTTWLSEFYSVEPFDGLGYERPLIARTDTVDLLVLLYGLVGIAVGFASSHKLPCCAVSVEQVKKTLTGKARATKDEMVHAARRAAGWKVSNDHEADAGGVGVYAYEVLWPSRKIA